MSNPAYRTWPSLTAMFFEQAKLHGDRPLLWAKKDGLYRPWTWTEVAGQVRLLARALRARGIDDGERVVLVSENRPEWLIADLAIMTAGGITVPAYTTNSEIDHRYIMTDSGAMAAIVSTPSLAQRVLPAVTDSHGGQFMVTMAPPEFDQLHETAVLSWQDMIAEGAEAPDEIDDQLARTESEDVACFIYTSGTGGAPKGVMLTHRNILANCLSAYHLLKRCGLGEEVFLSFLPLSHAYEHTAGQFFPLSIGAQIYYAESADKLLNNLAEARPTIMTAVPRLYESMHQRICRAMDRESRIARYLFDLTVKLGRKRATGSGRLNPVERLLDLLAERFVRAKMRQRFGGRLKAMVSGGAALNPDIGRFFTALGLPILQGYGQTEAAPIISANPPYHVRMETVGPPLYGVEVKIAEDGEILVRGDMVMKGYWRAKDATAAALRDGWLHTGDVGEIDEDGYLVITDRKKDIIVFSGGDNVSPARVEGILTLEPEVSQAMVYGDHRPHLVALLVPEEEFLRRWAKSNGKGVHLAELAGTPDFHKAFSPVVERVNNKLSNLEKIRRFAISPEPFTVANGLMTPTLKIRRHKIRAAYGKMLEGLY
jgi:long-chain acyl-CoA synthetase